MEAQKKIESINIKKIDTELNNGNNKEEDINNFNISFFLPKDVYENIKEDKTEKKINPNNDDFEPNKNNNTINLKDKRDDIFSNIIPENNYDFKINNNDELNINFINNEQQKIQHPFYLNNNSNNNNNLYIPNINEKPLNYYFNNNTFNINYSPNIPNQTNYPQIPNYSSFSNPYAQFSNANNWQINMNPLNNFENYNSYNNYNESRYPNNFKHYKKKIKDEYTIEMFGKWGWICKLCNNFNYDTRKKCNRCHENKNPKKIKEYLEAEKIKKINQRKLWFCKYCGNYNYAFRLICNRCKRQKDI